MAASSERYNVTRYELAELMAQRREDGVAMVNEFGGTEGLCKRLDTNLTEGLGTNHQDLESRRGVFGRNFIEPNPPKSFLALCVDAIQDKTLIILIGAALISIGLGLVDARERHIGWIDGVAILAAVVIVVLVTALNDWTKERQFRGLQKRLETDSRFSVIRGGVVVELPLAEIVVGDVAQFKYGNTFPVDGILIQGFDVKVDEASLTGESELQKKSPERDPMLLAGTQVMEGGGTMLVTAVGEFSQQGIIVKLLTQRSQDEGGFIALALRRWRKKLCGRCMNKDEEAPPPPIRSTTPNNVDDKNDLEIQEIKYDPDKPVANSNVDEDEEEEEVEPEPPLRGTARFNVVKQIQRRKRNKQIKKKKKKSGSGDGLESTSVLQKKLSKLAVQIGYAGTAAAVLCVVVLVLVYVITMFAINNEVWNSTRDLNEFLHFFIIGVIVLVVAVPEGLPLAVTISLAYSVKKMLKDHNLVRHLHACETMGNATAICSDKTGTLTTNRMTVVESYFCGVRYEVTPDLRDLPADLVDVLKLNIAVNSSYTSKLVPDTGEDEQPKAKGPLEAIKSLFSKKESKVLGQGLAKQLGNVTECALLGFLVELGIDYETLRDQHPTEIFTKVFTFNSLRKSMSTIIPLPGGGYRLLTKGASEIVLNKCTSIMAENGRIAPLSPDDKKSIVSTVVQSMASNALRTICLAYRDFPSAPTSAEITMETDWDDEENVVSGLTCIGIVGIQDPVRPEVPRCIASCQKAGITVRMVTGDNVDTARAIAFKCGIITKNDGYLVVDGKEFNKRICDSNGEVSQDKFDRLWPRLRVLARSSPTDKYTLVDGMIRSRLHKNREVVAVTGDGTNDGPALKRADVGFAMGIAGTDVAKEACDIILTDDNFASIVKAVTWGRNVYDSISKFIQFQLTVNIVAVTLTLISAFSIGDSPLRALQLLWVNLIMDTLASLALATEPPTEELLKRKPYGRNKPLISREMALFLAAHSIYQLVVLLVILFPGPSLFSIDDGKGRPFRAPPSEHFTLIFNTFVFMQIFNEINARKIHGERNVFGGIWKNWIYLFVVIGQVTVQVIIVEFGNIVFSTGGLPADLWMWCIFLGSLELLVQQVVLFIPIHAIPLPWKHVEVADEGVDYDPFEDEASRARYLWAKSLSRLRTQIRVVNAFRAGVDQGSLAHIPQIHGTPRSARYNRPVTGMETAV